jgi:4-hydroxy-2-oxovalerate aldolase
MEVGTMDQSGLQIIECTLRDGSYVIDFQFTARDTAMIAVALENAGCQLIEIGHGLGLNASNCGKGVAAGNDEEYLKAAADNLKRSKWGMFFIPGIGRDEDLELASEFGMPFVRIGTNATEVTQSKRYIEKAKKLGMFVSANLMKSYALAPKMLAAQAKLSEAYGADVACLVDSAGFMLPEDVEQYIRAMQEVLTVPTGLHCHDNLSLGVANVLTAIKCGARYIDTTLQGMGRGGGNPATEVLVAVLRKKGVELGINLNRLMDISERFIKPMLKEKSLDSINITSGMAGFHSSYMQTVLKYADDYHVDPRDVIIGVSKVDQVYVSEEVVEDVARKLQRQQSGRSGLRMVSLPRLAFPEEKKEKALGEGLFEVARKVAGEVRSTARKNGKSSVFNIVAAPQPTGKAKVSRFIQEEFDFVIASVEVDSRDQMIEVIKAVDGIVDILLVDSDWKPYLDYPLIKEAYSAERKSQVLAYQDNNVWVHSVNRQIGIVLQGVCGRHVSVCGTDNLALKLVLSLIEQGAEVTLTGDSLKELKSSAQALWKRAFNKGNLTLEVDPICAARQAEVLVSFDRQKTLITYRMIEALRTNGLVLDAGIGSVSAEAIALCYERGIQIFRPDMRAALAAELASIMGASRIVKELMGAGKIADIPVVAGGLVGQYGSVVLDSISNPSRVIGVADGHGRVIYERREEFMEKIKKVEEEILRKQMLAE